MPQLYPDYHSSVRFNADGPQPQLWLNTPGLKVVLIGLEPGQQAGPHAAPPAVYHILEGTGWAMLGSERKRIGPGATLVVEGDVIRGIEAETRLVFLGARVP